MKIIRIIMKQYFNSITKVQDAIIRAVLGAISINRWEFFCREYDLNIIVGSEGQTLDGCVQSP